MKDILNDIKSVFNPTDDEIYKKYIENFRKYYIPERYNQVKLLDELNNPEIDHFFSISNRTDGKSFNYIHALINIAIDYDLGITFLSRNMMLRASYQTLIEEIIEVSPLLDRGNFTFIRTQYYLELNYNGKQIALISDLNNATELKYFSNFIKKFPIIVYDEFLALDTDYLPDEWERLKTIYESIDRVESYPLIDKPKVFYFGNAVNFNSPILHGFKLFNILENHPINTAKTYFYDFNIMLETSRNENANEQRNTRAFSSKNDSMTTGQFKTNSHMIATDNDRIAVKRNPRTIYIKLEDTHLKIWYNPDNMIIILSIESWIGENDYQYNLLLKDNKRNSKYLNEKYFDENHIKRIDRGNYLFDNNFSRNYIVTDSHILNELKINKIIREVLREESKELELESKEKQFTDNYIEESKKAILRKFWGE